MGRVKAPVTQAVRTLRAAGVAFEGHPYAYVEGGGTAQFAREQGVDEQLVVKTLILEDERGRALIALMHGDREVSMQALARQIGVKRVRPCAPAVAERHSGYKVGGTSPFGTREAMPIYCQASIADLPRIYINGGKRGYIISLATQDMLAVLEATLLEMSQP